MSNFFPRPNRIVHVLQISMLEDGYKKVICFDVPMINQQIIMDRHFLYNFMEIDVEKQHLPFFYRKISLTVVNEFEGKSR